MKNPAVFIIPYSYQPGGHDYKLKLTNKTIMNFLTTLVLFLSLTAFTHSQKPVSYVDPLIGTAPATTLSARRHSVAGSEEKGQTFPAVGRPFGMTQWTPETRTTELKCISPYYFNDNLITGFRGSHWMSGSRHS